MNNAKLQLNNCQFAFCQASGLNRNYGRILYALSSSSEVQEISAFQCASSNTSVGDSVFHFAESQIEMKLFNSSYCYGSDGSASFSAGAPKSLVISFIIASDSCDHNSFEIFESTIHSTVSYLNLINTSMNFVSVLNIDPSDSATLKYCFFSEMKSKFNTFDCNIVMMYCKADEPINGYDVDIASSPGVTFVVAVQLNTLQQLCTRQTTFHFYTKIHLFLVFIK